MRRRSRNTNYRVDDGRFFRILDFDDSSIFIKLILPRDFYTYFDLLFPNEIKAKIGDETLKLRFLGIVDIEGGKREVYEGEDGRYYYKVTKNFGDLNEEHFYPIMRKSEIDYIKKHFGYLDSYNKNKNQSEQN